VTQFAKKLSGMGSDHSNDMKAQIATWTGLKHDKWPTEQGEEDTAELSAEK
jgi:hypothetical protein